MLTLDHLPAAVFYLRSQLVQIGLVDVHNPVSVQQETTFVPPGQRRRRINSRFCQQVDRLSNQSPSRIPTWTPHDGVEGDGG